MAWQDSCLEFFTLPIMVLSDFAAVANVSRDASHAPYYELVTVTEQVALTRKLEQKLLGTEPLKDIEHSHLSP